MSYISDYLLGGIHAIFLGGTSRLGRHKKDVLFYEASNTDAKDPQIIRKLPPKKDGYLRFVIVSDTHDKHRAFLPKDFPADCDVFIHCGDILMTSRFFSNKTELRKLVDFNAWLGEISAPTKIVIAGNHDMICEDQGTEKIKKLLTNGTYLENEMIKIGNSLTLWATPLSAGHSGNKAYQGNDYVDTTFKAAPSSCDILLTHGHCPEIEQKVEHKIKIWGHHHSSYGIRFQGDVVKGATVISGISVCAPMMTKYYGLRNPPIVLDLPYDLSNIPKSTAIHAPGDKDNGNEDARIGQGNGKNVTLKSSWGSSNKVSPTA